MTRCDKLGKDGSGRTIFAKLSDGAPVIDEGLQDENPEISKLLEEHELTHRYHDPRDCGILHEEKRRVVYVFWGKLEVREINHFPSQKPVWGKQ